MARPLILLDNNRFVYGHTPVQHALAVLRHRGKRLKRPPKMSAPDPVKREYQRRLLAMIRDLQTLVRHNFIPRLEWLTQRAEVGRPVVLRDAPGDEDDPDSWARELEDNIEATKVEFARTYTDEEIRRLATVTGRSVAYWNKRQLGKVVSRVLDIDLVAEEPWLGPELQRFAAENVGLIKSIPKDYFAALEKRVYQGFREGSRWTDIADSVLALGQSSESKANLIARDQVGKLNGQVNGLRQQAMGVKGYLWRNSADERVRGNPAGLYPNVDPQKNHWTREGKFFLWSQPPKGGHPGQDIQCRCYAEAAFQEQGMEQSAS